MDNIINENILESHSVSTVSNNSDLFVEIADLENAENHYIEQSQLIITPSSSTQIIRGFDVTRYLECTKGKIIKSYYEGHNCLGSKQQTDLSNLIIEKKFDFTKNYKITTDRLLQLSKQINEIFETEKENIYFIPYNKLTKQLSTGKLYSAYNKLRSKIKNSAVPGTNANISTSADIIHEKSIEFLKVNVDPYDEVIRHWKISTSFRLQELKNRNDLHISKYFLEYPALKCSTLLYDLFEIDFKFIYKDSINKLYDDWPVINKILIEIAQTRGKSNNFKLLEQQIVSTPKEITGFFLLPCLINSNFGRKRQCNGTFKLTKSEISDQFIIRASDITHMHRKIRDVKVKIESLKETFQPLPIILGDNDPVGYIYIDDQLYLIGSPIRAIDLCFKIFQVTNSKFPVGAEALWVFIQQCVYQIKTSWDKNFISVNNLISLVETNRRRAQNFSSLNQ